MTAAVEPRTTRSTAGTEGRSGSLAGTGALTRLIVRRDRVRLALWLVGLVAFVTLSAASVPELFPTDAELHDRGQFVQSPVLAIFTGPGYGTTAYTAGAMVANEYLIYGLVAVALMSVFLVTRHTRGEEESGRAELVRAAVVGPYAMPAAALAVAAIANLVIGATTAVALTVTVEELDAAGSWTFGMSMAATGLVYAGVAAVAVQVTEHARGAIGIAVGAVAFTFALRAIGDMGDSRLLSWLSPFGWAQSTRAYVDERWWPLLLSVAAIAVFTVAAVVLVSHRDSGAGHVRPRPGPASASRSLASLGGLALRLQRGSLIAWSAGLAALGAAFGALLGEVEVFLTDNPQLQEFFGGDDEPVLDAFLSTVLTMLGLLATACAVSAALSARREETAGRAEPVLATPVSRARWATGHHAVALGGGTAAMLSATAGVAITATIERGELSWLTEILGAGLSHLPAIWFTVAAVAVLYGLSSRAAPWGWLLLAYAAFVALMADGLGLPDRARVLSPFHHLPALPGSDVLILPLVILTVAAATLIALALGALTRRDITTT